MNRFQFAMSLIRAPWASRLMDRTFITTVGTAATTILGLGALWRTPGVSATDKVHGTIAAWLAVSAVVASWNHGQQKKDSAVAAAALAANPPLSAEDEAAK